MKDGPGRFSYETNYLVDTDHGIIMDVEVTPARLSQEIISAKVILERSARRHNFRPDRIAADGSYGTGSFLAWLLKREITPHVPVLDRQHQTKGKYDIGYFQYDADRDSYTCLEGGLLHCLERHRRGQSVSQSSSPCRIVEQIPDEGDLIRDTGLASCKVTFANRSKCLDAFQHSFGGAEALEPAHWRQAVLENCMVAFDPIVEVLSRDVPYRVLRT
ncbi:transposase [Roseobacter weihaiensis]|uniref:transposase n=1 Tax=Roseobacter weihaiensis TaxID=2763262 RepID=UPI002223A75E|nr:transposase [Roseobacter sp. H9]